MINRLLRLILPEPLFAGLLKSFNIVDAGNSCNDAGTGGRSLKSRGASGAWGEPYQRSVPETYQYAFAFVTLSC